MSTYRARFLPKHRGPAAWNTLLGAQAPARVLDGAFRADIAIIGAGFAGLSAARWLVLHDPHLRVVLIEAGRLAEGAAGRNSGFMIDLPHELTSEDYAGAGDDRTLTALNRQAISFAAEAVRDYQIPRDYFDPAGKVNGATSDAALAHNASYGRHLDTLGEPYEMLDAQDMVQMTGSRHYRAGLFTPGTVMLQPAGYVRGLAAGLSDAVGIYENSPVLSLSRTAGDWRIQTGQGQVTCAKVILATNGHLESFGFAKGRLMQVFLYASMTRELDSTAMDTLGGTPRWGITPSDPMGTTMRRIDTGQGGNRIVTRTCATLRSGMSARASDLSRAARIHQRKFDTRFPQLRGLRMAHAWAGHLCLSLNGVSVTQELEPGLISACVQNGLGTARGTLSGIAAAQLVLGQNSDVTRHFAQEDPPKKLPFRPVRDIGANAVLRWKEWKARAE